MQSKRMIKVVIIEDEIPARKKLKRFLEEISMPVEIIAEIDSVQSGVAMLKTIQPDLIISDIELLDGNSFEIYEQVEVTCPVIFTTAFDQFLMDAFESNGIAYLLKPFTKERFQKAWDKFLLLRRSPFTQDDLMSNLAVIIKQNLAGKTYRKRFSINHHQGIYFVETENIVFFEATNGVVFAHDMSGSKHLLTEATLKEIEDQLDAQEFFRINRGELVSKKYIEKVERFSKNSLAIKLKGQKEYLKTSQSSTADFREWVEK